MLNSGERYNHLSPSVQKSIWKDNDLLLIDPRTEADLIAETADLKAETEMLRKHTKLLKEQRRAMKQVFAEEKAARKRRREQVEQRRAKWTQERDEYRTRIDDMIKTLIGLVSHIHSQHGALSSLPGEKSAPIVDALLEFDDKTISRLGEIAETTEETADTGEDVFIQEVDELALKWEIPERYLFDADFEQTDEPHINPSSSSAQSQVYRNVHLPPSTCRRGPGASPGIGNRPGKPLRGYFQRGEGCRRRSLRPATHEGHPRSQVLGRKSYC